MARRRQSAAARAARARETTLSHAMPHRKGGWKGGVGGQAVGKVEAGKCGGRRQCVGVGWGMWDGGGKGRGRNGVG